MAAALRAAAACALLSSLVAAAAAGNTVTASSPSVRWVGRTVADGDAVFFDWSGVFAEVTVTNASWVTATIVDQCGGSAKVGGGSRWAVEVTPLSASQGATMAAGHRVATFYSGPWVSEYVLFSNLGGGCDPPCDLAAGFSLRLTRITESRVSGCGLAGNLSVRAFTSDGAFAPPPPPAPRKLIVIGDSITAGDLNSGGIPFSPLPGPALCANAAYNDDISRSAAGWACAAATGLPGGADCHLLGWGGIKLGVPGVQGWGMAELYPFTFSALGTDAYTPWDGSRFVPDAVVVNLGTNDRPPLPALWWQEAYVSFVQSILASFTSSAGGSSSASGSPSPAAAAAGSQVPVLLLYGPMTDEYAAPVLNVTATLVAAGVRASALNVSLGHPLTGCYGHPSAADDYEIGVGILVPALQALWA